MTRNLLNKTFLLEHNIEVVVTVLEEADGTIYCPLCGKKLDGKECGIQILSGSLYVSDGNVSDSETIDISHTSECMTVVRFNCEDKLD